MKYNLSNNTQVGLDISFTQISKAVELSVSLLDRNTKIIAYRIVGDYRNLHRLDFFAAKKDYSTIELEKIIITEIINKL